MSFIWHPIGRTQSRTSGVSLASSVVVEEDVADDIVDSFDFFVDILNFIELYAAQYFGV